MGPDPGAAVSRTAPLHYASGEDEGWCVVRSMPTCKPCYIQLSLSGEKWQAIRTDVRGGDADRGNGLDGRAGADALAA